MSLRFTENGHPPGVHIVAAINKHKFAAMMDKTRKLGLIVNPLAGIGGRVGLKGSDGADIVARALSLGAVAQANYRVGTFLERVSRINGQIMFFCFAGEMGESALNEKEFSYQVIGRQQSAVSTADDTIAAAKMMRQAGVELLVFAGGDGTARNIMDAIGEDVPVIGIPSGVKMHSAVYATTPANAGDLCLHFLQAGNALPVRIAEVMDIDEEAFRHNQLSANLYGYMKVPIYRNLLQSAKAGNVAGEMAALDSLSCQIAKMMQPDTYYFLGPGTTLRAVAQRLKVDKTLLGIDVVRNGKLIFADATENDLLKCLDMGKAVAIVTVIGGQGHVLGRGNQQLSPEVLKRLGRGNILIAATESKILSLFGKPLSADTGDPELDQLLSGYVRVYTALGKSLVYPLG